MRLAISVMTKAEYNYKSNVRRLRREHGYSGYKVAQLLGMVPSNYYRMENFSKSTMTYVTFQVLDNLSSIYSIPISKLFAECD